MVEVGGRMDIAKAYREPGAPEKAKKIFLSNEVYIQAVDALPRLCVDVVIVNKSRSSFFLPYRWLPPVEGYWFIGGRVFVGEDFAQAIKRRFQEDTMLDLDPERFSFVGYQRHLYKERPMDNFSVGFAVELTNKELTQAATGLNTKEYEANRGLKEFTYWELVKNNVHPAVIDFHS